MINMETKVNGTLKCNTEIGPKEAVDAMLKYIADRKKGEDTFVQVMKLDEQKTVYKIVHKDETEIVSTVYSVSN